MAERISRREFIRLSVCTTGGFVLSACSRKGIVEVTQPWISETGVENIDFEDFSIRNANYDEGTIEVKSFTTIDHQAVRFIDPNETGMGARVYTLEYDNDGNAVVSWQHSTEDAVHQRFTIDKLPKTYGDYKLIKINPAENTVTLQRERENDGNCRFLLSKPTEVSYSPIIYVYLSVGNNLTALRQE